MLFRRPGPARTCEEIDVVRETLEHGGRDVLEIGCGTAHVTALVAGLDRERRIVALEVDEIQLAANLARTDLPNVRFQRGAAESIPAADASFDVVLLVKSFHHVPVERMADALREIHRVLRPGGLVHVSEPLPEGPAFEVLRVLHDETRVRTRAFEALVRSLCDGTFELVRQTFYQAIQWFADVADYEARVVGATHQHHDLNDDQRTAVRELLGRHTASDGIHLVAPQRVDLLRRPS